MWDHSSFFVQRQHCVTLLTHVLSLTDTVVLYIQVPGISDYVIATQLIA